MTPGPLILVSGPSGSGKSTLIRRVLEAPPYPLRLAVSATTRPPRTGEIDGEQYHFWTPDRFLRRLAEGAFLEHAIVHGQHHYGTPRSEVDGYREKGVGVVKGQNIDLQGSWKDDTRQYEAKYSGTFVRRSAQLKGTQIWTDGGKTTTRNCSGAIKRPLKPFLPRSKLPA